MSLQAYDGLLADHRGLGEPLAEVQAGSEQARDRTVIGVLGEQDLQFDLAVDTLSMTRPGKSYR